MQLLVLLLLVGLTVFESLKMVYIIMTKKKKKVV